MTQFAITILMAGMLANSGPVKAVRYLQGHWQLTKDCRESGNALNEDFLKSRHWRIEKDKVTLNYVHETGTYVHKTWDLKIDVTTAPMQFDLTIWKEGKAYTAKGIMKVEKDELKVCRTGFLREDRPSTFSSTAENSYYLYVFKRIEAKPEK